MPNLKTIFTCQKCDAQSPKWAGRCAECGGWGTLREDLRTEKPKNLRTLTAQPGKTITLGEIKNTGKSFQTTGLGEVDRVLGGGIPAGAIILLAGEPGIGKSTLVAQIANHFSPLAGKTILYVSGEESPEQLKGRFDRMEITNQNIHLLSDTNAETIVATIETAKPVLTIIDSVQTLTADAAAGAGSLTQLRASTALIAETAKHANLPVLLIGQVTKSLDIAGPKSLEHLVDIVLTFEGDRYGANRILRATKNRFGPTDEIGIFSMTETGLKEIANPSAAFLERRSEAPGSIVTCLLEGSRPILVEIQALVNRSRFSYPEQRATGFDQNRLNVLLAVLEKKGIAAGYDVHINVTGGFKIREPAADLAVLLAIISSFKGKIIPQKTLAFGEVGLSGELRAVRDPNRRINEARKLGFTATILPQTSGTTPKSDIHECANFKEAADFLSLL